MPAPSVTLTVPEPNNYPDTITRPQTRVTWSGATGPTVDVLHEWDTDNLFGSPIQDLNAGVAVGAGSDVGTPPSDLGPAGTTWYYRVTVTDNADSAATTSGTETLTFIDPDEQRRYLHHLANVGVSFTPTDVTTPGPDDDAFAPDGDIIEFRRYLHHLANITTDTPTPHIWYVFPSFGREGWEFRIIGYGFGDTQGTYTGSATLDGLGLSILTWQLIAESSADLTIDPIADIAEPIHQEIRTQVPVGGTSGLVIVCTDGP